MKSYVANTLPLVALVACGLLLGCNAVLDIRPGRKTCGIHAPVCADPSFAHWDPTAPKRYVADDETVCDEGTGLLWSRVPDDAVSLEAAEGYCAGVSLGGLSGFRLPTRIELASIVDYARTAPAIDSAAFVAPPEPYWSSSESVGFPDTQLYLDFATGKLLRQDMNADPEPLYRARCVRRDGEGDAPECGDPSCINGRYCPREGVLTDVETHLEWQAEVSFMPMDRLTWDDAMKRCEELSLGEGGGWRLPRVEELQTLIKDTLEDGETTALNGAIDRDAFTTQMPLTYYWTSSDYSADTTRSKAWTVSFVDGALFEFDKTRSNDGMTPFAARCVRDAR